MPTVNYSVLVAITCLSILPGCGGTSRKAVAGPPATTNEAAKVLDLAQHPLPKDAEAPGRRCLAELTFNAAGKPKPLFEEQKKYFIERGWNEEPHTYLSDESCSATLTKDGFVVSLSSIPGSDGKTMVSILQHGNIDLASLPMPANAKSLYSGPVSSIVLCETNPAETKVACQKLLVAKGWQPYGHVADTQYYKQNAIRLSTTIGPAPAQCGKTTISYSAQLMSAELPLLLEAKEVSYTDSPPRLQYVSAKTVEDIANYYRQELGKQNWKATTDTPIVDGNSNKSELIFRNPQKDLIWLTMQEAGDQLRVKLDHQTAAEVEAVEKRLRERFEKEKKGEKAEAEDN